MSKNQLVLPSNRKFGLVFTIFFSILGYVLLIVYETHAGFVAVLLAVTFAILSFFAEDKLLPINKAYCIVLSTGGLANAAAALFGAFDSIRAAMAARTRALIESLVPCGHSISLISINSKAAGSSA